MGEYSKPKILIDVDHFNELQRIEQEYHKENKKTFVETPEEIKRYNLARRAFEVAIECIENHSIMNPYNPLDRLARKLNEEGIIIKAERLGVENRTVIRDITSKKDANNQGQ